MTDTEKSIDDRIKELLLYYGVREAFEIEDEAKEHILNALSADDVARVYIDEENGLCIDCYGD